VLRCDIILLAVQERGTECTVSATDADYRLVRVTGGKVEQIRLTETIIGVLRVSEGEWKSSDLIITVPVVRTAIVKEQKTGWYVTSDDPGEIGMYADEFGHMWFSKVLAREIAKSLPGGWFELGNRTSIKQVVVRYEERLELRNGE
jgi:hypothetical protein